MRRLLNGAERDPVCACQHGPAVHRGGRCVFQRRCGCPVWNPVPYVYDEPDCPRCEVLEAALRELDAPIPGAIPAQRKPPAWETRQRAAMQSNRNPRI